MALFPLLAAAVLVQHAAEIDRLHHVHRLAHVTANADSMVAVGASWRASAARGTVTLQVPAQMRQRFGAYFAASRFLEWEDIRPPVVMFSADSTMAFAIIEKRVRLLSGPPGAATHEAVRFAWTESWVRDNGRWLLQFVTSTDRPEAPDSIPLAARERAWDILSAAREAMGGNAAVAGVMGMSYRADVRGPRSSFVTTVDSWRDGRARMRQEFSARPPEMLERRSVRAGDPDTLTAVEWSVLAGHEIPLLAIAPESRYTNPRALPDEMVDGTPHAVVRFSDMLNGSVDVLYDSNTRLPRLMRQPNHTGRGAPQIVVSLGDWRRVREVLLPFATVFEHGNDTYRYGLTTIQLKQQE